MHHLPIPLLLWLPTELYLQNVSTCGIGCSQGIDFLHLPRMPQHLAQRNQPRPGGKRSSLLQLLQLFSRFLLEQMTKVVQVISCLCTMIVPRHGDAMSNFLQGHWVKLPYYHIGLALLTVS